MPINDSRGAKLAAWRLALLMVAASLCGIVFLFSPMKSDSPSHSLTLCFAFALFGLLELLGIMLIFPRVLFLVLRVKRNLKIVSVAIPDDSEEFRAIAEEARLAPARVKCTHLALSVDQFRNNFSSLLDVAAIVIDSRSEEAREHPFFAPAIVFYDRIRIYGGIVPYFERLETTAELRQWLNKRLLLAALEEREI